LLKGSLSQQKASASMLNAPPFQHLARLTMLKALVAMQKVRPVMPAGCNSQHKASPSQLKAPTFVLLAKLVELLA
jgi:hypothetical protein